MHTLEKKREPKGHSPQSRTTEKGQPPGGYQTLTGTRKRPGGMARRVLSLAFSHIEKDREKLPYFTEPV
jgi:hypothetical protein